MNNVTRKWYGWSVCTWRDVVSGRTVLLAAFVTTGYLCTSASVPTDSSTYTHRIAVDVIPGTILHTNRFLKGDNPEERTMNHAFTAHVKYAFMKPAGSQSSNIYKDAYQGIGLAYNEFNPQLGHPLSAYIYQGARIAAIVPRLTFNYEWNLGLAMGWHAYDPETNSSNLVIGSKVTAYIGADFFLTYRLSRCIDVNAGISLAHYSNGNTQFPNAGLNTGGIRAGIAYYVNRPERTVPKVPVPAFDGGMSCDVVLFGAWRRRGMYSEDGHVSVLPGTYGVAGFNITPVYNINHWLNAGLSFDGVYDHSANIVVSGGGSPYTKDDLYFPGTSRQMALGVSARAEFVMPYFTINLGLGTNVINNTDEFKGVYEVLALKINATRRVFAHIGYTLNNFRNPRFLMLGMGYRFGKVRKSN